MWETALDYLDSQDSFAAIEYLGRQSDPLAAGKAYSDLVNHLYWKRKDLQGVIVMACAGIQYGLLTAIRLDADDPLMAAQLRSLAKGLAYDLGSYTWPGWDEPGIDITAMPLAFGMEGAKVNLRLAHELDKGDLPLARAYWLLGAHSLAAGNQEAAHTQFGEATDYARRAGAGAEALLFEGYRHMATALVSSDEAAGRKELDAIQAQLAGTEEGKGFSEQLKTARQVFFKVRR